VTPATGRGTLAGMNIRHPNCNALAGAS